MTLTGATASGILAGLAAVLTGIAAIVAASHKRARDYDDRLAGEVTYLRTYVNALRRALGQANHRLIGLGEKPVDVPVEQEKHT